MIVHKLDELAEEKTVRESGSLAKAPVSAASTSKLDERMVRIERQVQRAATQAVRR